MTNKANTAEVLRLADHHLQIQNNGELLISTGKSRFETAWKNKTIYWSALLLLKSAPPVWAGTAVRTASWMLRWNLNPPRPCGRGRRGLCHQPA